MLSLVAALLVAAAGEPDAGEPILETTAPILGAAPVEADAGVAAPTVAADAPVAPPPLAPEPTPAIATDSPPPPQAFVKGELSVYLGSDRLVVKNNRIGVSAGLDRLGSIYYLLLEPQVDLRFLDAKLAIGLGVPLRLELLNFNNGPDGTPLLTKNLWHLRTEDYDSVHDFGRILKYVNYGRKEDNLYINIGQRYSTTIGHGSVMRRYAPNIDIDYPRASAEVDAYNDFGGFELFTNDVLEWNQFAGIAFLKPLWFMNSSNLLVKSLSLGVSGGLDRNAPLTLTTDASGVRQVVDGRLAANTRPLGLYGFDAEVKVYRDENIDLKPYVDYSMLAGGDGGLTLGVLGRFNFGKEIVNAFRVVTELKFLGSRYQPSYFDTFYEVERFIYDSTGTNSSGFIQYRTKQDAVLGAGLGQRTGYYLEGSWGIRGAIGLTLSLEGVSNSADKNFVAHLEVPVLSFLQIFGSFYKRRFQNFSEFGQLDEKAVLFAGARLKILPFLFLNGRAYKTFRVNPDTQRYDNQFGFVIDLEVGYEFGGKKPDAPTGTTPATQPAPPPDGTPPPPSDEPVGTPPPPS